MPTLPAHPDALYAAFLERDPSWEGLFYVCVRTTGIFCRPTCRARKPNRDNVDFVRSPRDALLAGYRPCKVCKPLDLPQTAPEWLTDLTARARDNPDQRIRERDLRDMDLDPDHVRRQCRRYLGMTFHEYQRALRLGRALRDMRNGTRTAAAASHAGYQSDSAFRDAFQRLFGSTPARTNGVAPLACGWIETPLGPMLAVASDAGLCLLEFSDRRSLQNHIAAGHARLRSPILPIDHPTLRQTRRELNQYFAGDRRRFDVPLDPRGTPFERAVWNQLLTIPHGQVRSYARIAQALDRPGASRAVGRANAANPIAIIVPCHRVIRADGSLCGYAGGAHRKEWLLEHEGAYATLLPASAHDEAK